MKTTMKEYGVEICNGTNYSQLAMDWMEDQIKNRNYCNDREKLFEKFSVEKSFSDFSEEDILRTILSCTTAAKNSEAVAAALIHHFGSVKAVLEARTENLINVPGIGQKTALMLSMIVPFAKAYEAMLMKVPNRIGNSRDAEHYCRSLLLGERIENFYVICLNAQCQVLGKRRISTGSLSEVSAYPRSVVETALNYNAHSVLLSHNHPGGTCSPSPEDISSTLQIQKLLQAINILTLDHIIVAGDQTYSMIQHGDIDYRIRR